MFDDDLMSTLYDVYDNAVSFQSGFRWNSPDGRPVGDLPGWQSAALGTLLDRGLVAVEPGDHLVRLTDRGVVALYNSPEVPLAA
ncbi:hypothetical protein CLV40_1246 [Actinokineospora auranticolor]|uniref:Uncharacterized protein n=2 Tax=Actinokineospora auranticolor TaxID=155976 RepID=A0A2S6GF61_9PSEU|nr:hypothetical protein CLV40_1246 [Actinokineospora auranticolor]